MTDTQPGELFLWEIFVFQVKSRQGLDTLVVVAGILPAFFKAKADSYPRLRVVPIRDALCRQRQPLFMRGHLIDALTATVESRSWPLGAEIAAKDPWRF